eukprot:1573194-Rhodomonas_salina.1
MQKAAAKRARERQGEEAGAAAEGARQCSLKQHTCSAEVAAAQRQHSSSSRGYDAVRSCSLTSQALSRKRASERERSRASLSRGREQSEADESGHMLSSSCRLR